MTPRRKTGGRQKGTRNLLTRDVKMAIERAFERVGSENYLVKVARDDPRTFCALLARVLPAQLEHSAKMPSIVDVTPMEEDRNPYDWARRIAFVLTQGARLADEST